ncbi:MAG TPA: hypothetical protein VFU43_26850 [Streptosporangiaceae bacterium]|nr:hypothetical protein [Streptosporangiaceae bacterium]
MDDADVSAAGARVPGQAASRDGYCDHCGRPLGVGGHADCRAARRLEPPRYCATCRRRLVVQVTPRGWSARCSRHGTVDSAA